MSILAVTITRESLEKDRCRMVQRLRDSTVSRSDIPEDREWIFDFEFVEEVENPKLRNQNNLDKNASKYAVDCEILNEYLRNQKKVIFRECVFV